MRKIVSLVVMVLVLAVATVAFGQAVPAVAAPAPGTAQAVVAPATAPVMCGALEVPAGCTCKDVAKNELDCPAGVTVALPKGSAGTVTVENGGKTTVFIPPIQSPSAVQPESKKLGFWDYALVGVGAVALGTATYYAVDSRSTTEVHIRDK